MGERISGRGEAGRATYHRPGDKKHFPPNFFEFLF
jgi:hypothetical protein